ncbi:small ribosomal subunit protein mS38 [Neosynchiropus ocellatus]
MLTSKLAPGLRLLQRASCSLPGHAELLNGFVQSIIPTSCPSLNHKRRSYATAADNTPPPRWVQLEPELEDALVPRKLSVSPLESWLSLRYSLPPLLESAQPLEEVDFLEEKMLPPVTSPVLEDGEGSVTPLHCKNVLKIRRRKMNRHKYKKLQKRTKFLRKKVMDIRGKKKQKKFEKDLQRLWRRAGLKKAPEGWRTPKIFLKQYGNKTD